MSLTGSHHAFAGIGENGLDEFLRAFLEARPRYLHYGTTPFVAGTTVSATNVPTIAFPGIAGGISYAVDLTIPRIDLYPADAPLPAPLALGPDQFAIELEARITLGCLRGGEEPGGKPRHGSLSPVAADLAVWAVGHPVVRKLGAGAGDVYFEVDEVLVVDVAPPALDALVDCLLRMILNGVLSSLPLPFEVVDIAFFKLVLEEGPLIAADRLELLGSVV
jgi:hypothetical protein